MSWRIGADIGGTFIDFCAFDEATGRLATLKLLATPEEPGHEVTEGLALLEERHGLDPAEVAAFVHGTTIGINTIIQRKGADLALLTTAGFEDVIELARLRMPEMHGLFCARAEPLVPRDRIFGIPERILADGAEQTPLDAGALRRAAAAARAKGAQGIVVAFLNAYRNAEHECRAKAILAEAAPDLFVFTSAEVWPVIREYERSTTAILNGYVHPRVARYLDSLEVALARRGIAAAPMVTKSNGGVMSAARGKTACVNMLLSGTASGVMGAAFLARQAGIGNLLTLDVGGTSADVALVIEGRPQFGMGETIGDLPLYLPSVSVTSIGDGGGSIASVDGFGVLKVGPESAGSTPGPACYGRGGTRATITDAMAVSGYLGHTPLAYASVAIDRSRAAAAVAALARGSGLGLHATAEAIVKIAISNMYAEINKLIARYGADLRDFTLMPFGGAGPMLGCLLADELDMERVLIPRRPGIVSALGGLIADVRNDFIRTLFVDAGWATMGAVAEGFASLRAEAESWLRHDQRFAGPAHVTLSADMRYAGQSFEIEVELDESWIAAGVMTTITEAFHRRHQEIYDFADRGAIVQIINLRLVITSVIAAPVFLTEERRWGAPAPEKQVEVWRDGAPRKMPLYFRSGLQRGHSIAGPAIVAQEDATIVLTAGFAGTVDACGNLHLRRPG
ncbi:MAG: hydantoinase/oxoprolinase family protein [Rhodospirillales bacterium]|nr:hydantoinase/oxoprolinase family protein [Rhodospirillales bacterium]